MIYCSVKYCCSNSSVHGVILHYIMRSIQTPNRPAYHWSTLWPLEVWVRGLYNSCWFCVHKLSMFIYLSMVLLWIAALHVLCIVCYMFALCVCVSYGGVHVHGGVHICMCYVHCGVWTIMCGSWGCKSRKNIATSKPNVLQKQLTQ